MNGFFVPRRHAVSLARAFNADLFLCHCTAPPTLVTIPNRDDSRDRAKKALIDSLPWYLTGGSSSEPRWEMVVETGNDVGAAIVRTAREQRADLIVMRSRRSGMTALLGSTAEQVSRTASCPVLVIHPQQHARQIESNSHPAFRRILVSHDFSSSSELALSYALSIAQRYGAELHLIHVLAETRENETNSSGSRLGVEGAYHRAVTRLQNSVPDKVYRNCTVTQVVCWGKPYCEVLAYSRKKEVDLVCMGATGRDFGREALFGSNVDRVLRQASCPVLIARPLKPAIPRVVDLRIQARIRETGDGCFHLQADG